jgi:hypothetical protein
MTSFNREEVGMSFDNLESVMVKFNFTGTRIFNVDETDISTVSDSEIILAEKGQKRIGTVSSGERGQLVTVIIMCIILEILPERAVTSPLAIVNFYQHSRSVPQPAHFERSELVKR